jgi:hypothetical protein
MPLSAVRVQAISRITLITEKIARSEQRRPVGLWRANRAMFTGLGYGLVLRIWLVDKANRRRWIVPPYRLRGVPNHSRASNPLLPTTKTISPQPVCRPARCRCTVDSGKPPRASQPGRCVVAAYPYLTEVPQTGSINVDGVSPSALRWFIAGRVRWDHRVAVRAQGP